ncbi:MAG: ester cyclase [Steroidobacteraceae bacterium]|jgi:predicted ester cyclase|nr:ester cyclase [Steroidobacteraceae bacterium]
MSVDFHAERTAYVGRLAAAHAPGGRRSERIAALYADDVDWHGPHPLNELRGAQAVVDGLWGPLLESVPDLERRDDILMAGAWKDSPWVAATGHYVGTFARDWIGIPATGVPVSIRYGEVARLAAGRVVEAYVFLDVLDVMRQAGVWPLAPPLGSPERWPGPHTRDGVIAAPQDAAESNASLALVEAMIRGLMEFDGRTLESMRMERFWEVERMMWYGPAGIGSCRGLKGFQDVHQRPFLAAFPDRVGGNHKCRIGEGAYVASTGWPSIRATHSGGDFLGLAPTGRKITMRVMDFWRREGERLVENWVFIDLPDLLLQMGYDVLGRYASHPARANVRR